jgi:hypothetical protein
MPKRVIDGDALWRSDKLNTVEPPWIRAEYANLFPLALANGVFECGARRIWSLVYSYNRPNVTVEQVEEILAAFAKAGMLFRWTATDGKVWGFWIGSDRPGRLPGRSRRGKNERVGPEPPADKLQKFMESNGIQELPGSGSGFGSGSGSGKNLSFKAHKLEALLDSKTPKWNPKARRWDSFEDNSTQLAAVKQCIEILEPPKRKIAGAGASVDGTGSASERPIIVQMTSSIPRPPKLNGGNRI